ISLAPLSTTEMFIYQFCSYDLASQAAAIFFAVSSESALAAGLQHRASAVAFASEYITDDFIAFLQRSLTKPLLTRRVLSRPLPSPREASCQQYSIHMSISIQRRRRPPASLPHR